MIRLVTDIPAFFNDLCEVVRLFWGIVEISPDAGERTMTHRHAETDGKWIEQVILDDQSYTYEAEAGGEDLERKRRLKRAVKTACFLLMRKVTGVQPPWGSLTGIRPTRIMYELMAGGLSPAEAAATMAQRYFVSPDKAGLLSDIIGMQRGLIDVRDDEFDLYIGIPFCVTRCAYCSFASGELGDGTLVEPYLGALKRELELCAAEMDSKGMKVRAAYMGGGTPTALTAPQLSWLLGEAQRLFPGAREWTVEAGRPDTIDRDRLQALLDRGVGRISVNPQTFSDQTLMRIGRAHTARQTLDSYALARKMGFQDINMDLIAALPGEDEADFMRSLRTTIELAPESVTVHTLAIKRSSRLYEQGYVQAGAEAAASMVSAAREALREAGYAPYYLYRQKYMAGNLENVGYCRPGKQCLYNIDNMEESTRVLACGAGAITKWLFPCEPHIRRVPNVRNIAQYIERVTEMTDRKIELINS